MLQIFFYFILLACPAAADIPPIIYRGIGSSPDIVQSWGGFHCRGGFFGEPKNPFMSFLQHVPMEPGNPGWNSDPWISTSKSYEWVRGYLGRHKKGRTAFIYHIKTAGLRNIIDIAEEYKAVGQVYAHSVEEEVAVKDFIPWSNIVSWDIYEVTPDGKVIQLPK
ncbi:hypothetical protein PpBr36_02650 [Pyricularia pennisetigena]|uniref:hypothetical protein n=1 Tax=Pyricularia pennisetigena TaxID=1578925 RepID=UPI00114F3CB6|nr:hypothetical protein PpBr36_02650 [Pyricularia pennisetigena]TLS30087.1 hypothetical protein PpBr36_02650 [Pyricularia pennisetigena]